MPSYKITKGSVKVENGHTRFKVTFKKKNGDESAEQFYEVIGTDPAKIYKALDKAAEGFDKMPSESEVAAPAPTLVTDKHLKIGVETKKALSNLE